MDLGQLVRSVLQDPALQESHWLEWKSEANLGRRVWQARAARFILGAANRPRPAATGPYEGNAFLLLGAEPGRAIGTNVVDPALVTQALVRYLGSVGPTYSLDYIPIDGVAVAVFTVPPPPTGNRPYLARGTFSGEREESATGGSTSDVRGRPPRRPRTRSTRCSPSVSPRGWPPAQCGRCRRSQYGGTATPCTSISAEATA